MVPRTRTLANSAPAAWHDWHGAISSCVDHGHVSRNSPWFRSGNQEIREFLLTSFQSENPRIQWFQSEKFTMKSSWNPRYFPRAIPVVLMMSWTICRNLSGSASAPAGRIDGISWEYHGDIMGILWGDQGNFNIIQNSYIPISIYIYIHILTYIHIYILFGISWISIEMIKLPSNHRIYQNWGYAINHQIIGVCPKIWGDFYPNNIWGMPNNYSLLYYIIFTKIRNGKPRFYPRCYNVQFDRSRTVSPNAVRLRCAYLRATKSLADYC